MYALILANGHLNDGPAVRSAIAAARNCAAGMWVIAADGGSRHADALGLPIDALVGDLDSVARAPHGVEVHRASPDKDETDLELALLLAVERGAAQIRIIGATGGRLDQTLGNVMLLALPALRERGIDARLVSGDQTAWLVEGHAVIEGAAGDTLSLLPLGGDAGGVRTGGLKYPLRGETLYFGPARGMSNVLLGARAEVWVERGRLLAVHTPGRA
ncbi:MAG: thiamine diphosphokinase [Anaerolineae bacterium]|nr:thiamine diphosphokinase [Anaerolineae bacterium]